MLEDGRKVIDDRLGYLTAGKVAPTGEEGEFIV